MMFLYEQFNYSLIAPMLKSIKESWNDGNLWRTGLRFTPRTHQDDALARLELYENQLIATHQERYLLFHMATGSGKTLVMASALLYYYAKLGYRRFVFITEKTVLLDKTRNVLTEASDSKYLFNQTLRHNNRRLRIHATDTVQDSTDTDIYICFKTIQTLQSELDESKARENATHLETLKQARTLFLVDEAHHFTDAHGDTEKRWKGILEGGHTIHQVGLLDVHPENRILGFSATLPESNRTFQEHYAQRILYNYDFKAYRQAGYTKEPQLLAFSSLTPEQRILLACLHSLWRQYVAGASFGLPSTFLPKVLVKFNSVATANTVYQQFERLLSTLTPETLTILFEKLDATLTITNHIQYLCKHHDALALLKQHFLPYAQKVAVIHGGKGEAQKAELIQRINTMDSPTNTLRMVFAVDMLNEGWDVLSLFDIVRYEESNSASTNIVTADVQLIGRGARYYPFKLEGFHENDKRKSIQGALLQNIEGLENLSYITNADNAYLKKLKTEAQKSIGGLEPPKVGRECVSTLKQTFKQSRVWQHANVVVNRFAPFTPLSLQEFKERLSNSHLNPPRRWRFSFAYDSEQLLLEHGEETLHLRQPVSWQECVDGDATWRERLLLSLLNSMDEDPYFRGTNLFTKLTFQSREEVAKAILNTMLPSIHWDDAPLKEMLEQDLAKTYRLLAVYHDRVTLPLVKRLIDRNMGSTDLTSQPLHHVLTQKLSNGKIVQYLNDHTEPLSLVQEEDAFFVFDTFYGTSLEKDVIQKIKEWVPSLIHQYDEVYLIRNHHFVKLYDEQGRGFEPDFLLYTYQQGVQNPWFNVVFIEPKNEMLAVADAWKAELLEMVFHHREHGGCRLLALGFVTENTLHQLPRNLTNVLT